MIKIYRDIELDSQIILADKNAGSILLKTDFFKIIWNHGSLMPNQCKFGKCTAGAGDQVTC